MQSVESKKDSVQMEMLAASATKTASVDMTEEDVREETHPEAAVHHEGNVRNRAEITSKETVRIRCVIVGILPYVKITRSNRDAKFGDECAFS